MIHLGIITNGSLFTEENTDFILKNNITVTISHDGPGQSMRSDDPFKDPENMKYIYKLCNHVSDNFSLNPVFSKENYSHKKVNDYFYDIFHKNIRLGNFLQYKLLVIKYMIKEFLMINFLYTQKKHINIYWKF